MDVDAESRKAEMRSLISHYNERYHTDGVSEIPDADYDRLVRELEGGLSDAPLSSGEWGISS